MTAFKSGLKSVFKSRMRGHVIVGVMTISTDVDKLYDTDLTDAAWALIAPMLPTGFWCKLLKGSVSCDNCRDDGTDLGTRSVQGTAF